MKLQGTNLEPNPSSSAHKVTADFSRGLPQVAVRFSARAGFPRVFTINVEVNRPEAAEIRFWTIADVQTSCWNPVLGGMKRLPKTSKAAVANRINVRYQRDSVTNVGELQQSADLLQPSGPNKIRFGELAQDFVLSTRGPAMIRD